MKEKVQSIIKGTVILSISTLMAIGSCYLYRYNYDYESINVILTKDNFVEFGDNNFDIKKFINGTTGSINEVVKDVDTSKIGMQEVLVSVSKGDATKIVPITVNVVDNVGPTINIKNENITVFVGQTFNPCDNIINVIDSDNELKYINSNDVLLSDVNYYTINGSVNVNRVDNYELEVVAVDDNFNKTTKKFIVSVRGNGKEENIKYTAYSLIGSPYAFGGMSPAGFDCSGFVKYVMSLSGITVGRSVGDNLYDGYEVSYDNIRVGDIIVWARWGMPAHSTIYVGNGQMIHAATPDTGVRLDNVAGWGQDGGFSILSIRRVY